MNFNILLLFSRKLNIFGGMKILWIFLGSLLNWTVLRGHFYSFNGLFWRSGYRMEDIFGVAKSSNNYYGCLKFLIFFGGEW